MSVLIKGMKMPEKCGKCRFATAFECQVTKNFITTFNVRQVDCPLVPVPPHGRLIDADALIAAHKDVCSRSMKFNLDLAPTIIEADKADMDSFIRIFEEDDEEDGVDSFIRILKD